MMEWFRSGGFGMFVVLIIGAGAIGYGAKVIGKPTAERVAMLRALPALLGMSGLFSFGTNMWAVNRHISDEAFLKGRSISLAEAPIVGIIGITESVQVLTLAGLLAMVVVALRIVAEAKSAKGEGG
jgi:hypothetical protein